MKKAAYLVSGLALAAPLLAGASGCSNVGGSSGKGSGATQVEYIVTGTAPSGADITYGDDSSRTTGNRPWT